MKPKNYQLLNLKRIIMSKPSGYWEERNESESVIEIFSNVMLGRYKKDVTELHLNNIKTLLEKRRVYALILEEEQDKKIISKAIENINIDIKDLIGL